MQLRDASADAGSAAAGLRVERPRDARRDDGVEDAQHGLWRDRQPGVSPDLGQGDLAEAAVLGTGSDAHGRLEEQAVLVLATDVGECSAALLNRSAKQIMRGEVAIGVHPERTQLTEFPGNADGARGNVLSTDCSRRKCGCTYAGGLNWRSSPGPPKVHTCLKMCCRRTAAAGYAAAQPPEMRLHTCMQYVNIPNFLVGVLEQISDADRDEEDAVDLRQGGTQLTEFLRTADGARGICAVDVNLLFVNDPEVLSDERERISDADHETDIAEDLRQGRPQLAEFPRAADGARGRKADDELQSQGNAAAQPLEMRLHVCKLAVTPSVDWMRRAVHALELVLGVPEVLGGNLEHVAVAVHADGNDEDLRAGRLN
eukprot:gene9208-biopygen338